MNRRGFIYGLLVTPFAALFARFKKPFANGGLIPPSKLPILPHCCDFSLTEPLAEKLLAEHKKMLHYALDVTYVTPTGIHNERHFLPLKPIAPMGEPRTFKYPLTGSIPWKPKDEDAV